ncbi:MAG: adenylate/guanylate cyclase domain-containing protein [Granulosicoccus sp.]
MAVPIALLILQIILVNHFIRELQSAVKYISTANSVIERNFIALEKLDLIRDEVKNVPARFVGTEQNKGETSSPFSAIWSEISSQIEHILNSDVFQTVEPGISKTVVNTRLTAENQIKKTVSISNNTDSDLDTLLEVAIITDRDLVGLKDALNSLVVELRQQIQKAVAHEKRIHDRPIIAGIAVGGLAILLIVTFTLIYIDGHLVARITALSKSMLAISGNDLRAEIPLSKSRDEIGEMADALTIFRDTAVEIEENNLRQVADAQQRLVDAIATLSEGFSLYDSDDRLVLCNPQYGKLFYPGLDEFVKPGILFKDLLQAACDNKLIADAIDRKKAWVSKRMSHHLKPGALFSYQLSDGRWIEIREHRTTNNETVAIYTDITKQRNSEIALVEAKNRAEEANTLVTHKNAMLEGLSAKLSKYLSPQIYSSIFRGEQNVELASERKKLTIMFTDLSGFTETADRLESEELTSLLNNYLTEMSKLALEHGATIDKYIGDAIMLFFGDPETKGVQQDAIACVSTAIAMQEKMSSLNKQWLDRGIENPFGLRIGINTGYCTVGNFGSEDRMDYTIIGSEVNLAQRLESASELGGILIGHETYSLVKDYIHAEEQESKSVKGFAKPVRNYSVVGLRKAKMSARNSLAFSLGGVEIVLDPNEMSTSEQKNTIKTLKNIIQHVTDSTHSKD